MNDKSQDISKSVLSLFLVFLAIVLKEGAQGILSLTQAAVMGGIVAGLSLFSILFPGKKEKPDLT